MGKGEEVSNRQDVMTSRNGSSYGRVVSGEVTVRQWPGWSKRERDVETSQGTVSQADQTARAEALRLLSLVSSGSTRSPKSTAGEGGLEGSCRASQSANPSLSVI